MTIVRNITAWIVLWPFVVGTASRGATPEVRGTWLTTTGVDHIRTGSNTGAVVADLRNIGLNTVYVETWKNGYTNYPSSVLASLTGGSDRSTFLGTTRDLVQETSIQAHRNQMAYVGWFEYGLAAQFIGTGGTPNNPLATYMRNQGWLLQDQAGLYGNASNGYAWMNPAIPEVRQFLIDITLEAAQRYDLDGIQFDDRLAWPREFGWDATTAALYLQQTGRVVPTNISDTRFREWRQDKVTLLAQELTAAVAAARPGLRMSIAPSITNFSDINYNAEWPAWQDAGLFNEYVPQVYRDSLSSFNGVIDAQVAPFEPSDLDELVVGLRINGSGANTPYADLQQMIVRSRTEGALGHSLWYSDGVRDDYGSQLTAFYNVAGAGHAPHPVFGDEWRSPPVVGTNLGNNQWQFVVDQANRYRVVGRSGSLWKELDTIGIAQGTLVLSLSGVSEAELLVDRRPAAVADLNFDGMVDAADYTLWRDLQGSNDNWLADLNGDRMTNAMDYIRWQSQFGQTVAAVAPTNVVAEPIGSSVIAVGAACVWLPWARARLRNGWKKQESRRPTGLGGMELADSCAEVKLQAGLGGDAEARA